MATDPQWHPQGLDEVKGVEGSKRPQLQVERRVRPHKEQALNCPRCNSANTKFCYYNNYSLSQPRYFCKTCRRYWTEGGSLRNVPVGGGSRKNKRSSSSSSSSFSPSTSSLTSSTTITTTTTTTITTTPSTMMAQTNTKYYHGGNDLNLPFANQNLVHHELGCLPALELLRSGMSARGLGSIAPMPMPMQMPMAGQGSAFGLGLSFQELMRPSGLKLPLGEVGGGGDGGGMVGGERRPLFPFEDLKQVPMSNGSHEGDLAAVQAQGDPTLFWNDVMGNGGVRGDGGGGTW